jgi:PAS domain S-box-containing protein
MNDKRKTKNHLNTVLENRQVVFQPEQYHTLAFQILELLNQTDNRTDLIKDILFLIKVVTGFEAVGIRLREGEDFPYYETIGFSKGFVRAETSLCSRDRAGKVIRDSRGSPSLECMCGNIIAGRTNPTLPFFTEVGSFWTNSTTEFLASTTEKDRQGYTRNRCNSEGYESVALIPLRCDKKNIGLLQFNDSQKDMFTLPLIHLFEGVGSSIGVALKIKNREDTLLQSRNSPCATDTALTALPEKNSKYSTLFHHSPIAIWEEDFSDVKRFFDALKNRGISDIRGYFTAHPEDVLSCAQKVKIIGINEATLKMFHARNEKELYRGLHLVFNKSSYDVFREELIALAEGKTEFSSEAVNCTLSGEGKKVFLKLVVVPGHETTLSTVFVYILDLSDQKSRDFQVKAYEEKYRKIFETAHDATLVADAETGIIIDTNKRTEELFGSSARELIGRHLNQLDLRNGPGNSNDLFHHIQQAGSIPDGPVLCSRGDENIPVTVNFSTLKLSRRKYIVMTIRQEAEGGFNAGCTIREDDPARLLTSREIKILAMIASGLSARQISERLYVSERTVTKHRDNIMQKLHVHKSVDLVRYALRCGLVDTEPPALS